MACSPSNERALVWDSVLVIPYVQEGQIRSSFNGLSSWQCNFCISWDTFSPFELLLFLKCETASIVCIRMNRGWIEISCSLTLKGNAPGIFKGSLIFSVTDNIYLFLKIWMYIWLKLRNNCACRVSYNFLHFRVLLHYLNNLLF